MTCECVLSLPNLLDLAFKMKKIKTRKALATKRFLVLTYLPYPRPLTAMFLPHYIYDRKLAKGTTINYIYTYGARLSLHPIHRPTTP